MQRIDHKIAYLLIVMVFLGAGSIFAGKYIVKTKNDTVVIKDTVIQDIVPTITDSLTPAVDEAIKEQIAKAPPKHSANQTVTTTTPNGSDQVTTITPSGINPPDYLSLSCNTSPNPSSVKYTDETGRYSATGAILTDYLNRLRWGGEISSLCGIYIEDAGDTGWSGQYVASYRADSSGRIVSATGAIILNSSYYRQLDLATFNEYMKLILSHEYGHHYTQYHKWIDMNLAVDDRFPDAYYSVRPLSKSATTVDCESSWDSCESEIIAEDYSYLYSGFSLHQMANSFGYPSAGTKTWLDSLTSYQAPVEELTQPNQNQNQNSSNANSNVNSNTNTNTNTNVNNNTNASDTTKPVVTIIDPTANPYAWDSSVQNLVIKIRSTDNVAVVKIKVYINDQYQGEGAGSGANLTWSYDSADAGTYVLKAEAYDAEGNVGEILLTINKS